MRRSAIQIFLTLAFALVSKSDGAISLPIRNVVCDVLPISPNEINGYTPCGGGSLIAGCGCCPDGQTTCQSQTQQCTTDDDVNYFCCELSGGSPSCSSDGTNGGSAQSSASAAQPSVLPEEPSPATTSPIPAADTSTPSEPSTTEHPNSSSSSAAACSPKVGGSVEILLTCLFSALLGIF